VVITPAGDRADEHIVKLTAGAGGTLQIADQAGGYLTAASLSQVPFTPGSGMQETTWGTWQLTVTGGSTPVPVEPPTVTGYRLTAAPDKGNYTPPASPLADDPCRPVYRFDVTGDTWKNVISAGQVTAQLPAMTAQGSSDSGHTWQDLGQLMPVTAPVVNPDGTVTLAPAGKPASFFFQNPAGTAIAPEADPAGVCKATGTNPPVTQVRVVMPGGTPSAAVNLADPYTAPPSPPPNGGTGATPVSSIIVTPTTGSPAAPRANGVDQATLGVVLTPANTGGIIPANDGRYQLIYYRQQTTNDLITGLYQPGGYDNYTAVGPAQGPYAGPAGPGEASNYLVTTTTANQNLIAVFNDTGTALSGGSNANTSGSISVAGTGTTGLTAGGTGAGGIQVTTTTAGPFALAAPTATGPALYQAGPDQDGNPATGLQLTAAAVTSPASLPLQIDGIHAHGLGSAPLTVTGSTATLQGQSLFWPADTIDSALVTAGTLVPVLSVTAGS
jgi:hypothetical protein